MRAALADHRAYNLRATGQAGLACALIDTKVILKIPSPVNPVDTGALSLYSSPQHLANRIEQTGNLFFIQPI